MSEKPKVDNFRFNIAAKLLDATTFNGKMNALKEVWKTWIK